MNTNLPPPANVSPEDQAWYNLLYSRVGSSSQVFTAIKSGTQVVTPRVQSLELNNTTAIAATMASSKNHPGLFLIKQLDSGTAGHTVTLSNGTWNGTNTVATLNAQNEILVVYFDSAGNGSVILNSGVVLS